MSLRRTFLLIFVAMATGRCSFLASKPSRFYAIEPIRSQAAISRSRGLPVGIDVVLPPGLNRKEIVTRLANQQLEIRGREQWTALLEPLIMQALAVDIADRLPDGMVILPGQPKPDGPMRSIDVVVQELAAGPDRTIVLDARWTLREPGHPEIAGHEHLSIVAESLESAQIAAGYSRVVALLADRLAQRLSGPS